jgi:serine/threonine protein kinase
LTSGSRDGEMENDPIDKPRAQGTPTGPATTPDYVSLREIGVGSYGRVWLVQDRTSGEYCAVKIIYRHLFDNEAPYQKEQAGVERFRQLSTASRSLLKIIHVGLHDEEDYFYYLMELADDRQTGQAISPANYVPRTLKWELEKTGHRERLPAEDCLRIILTLTAGLEELHQGGLIHRDVKPANIIFVKGQPKLADIGLVTSKDLTRTIVGTPGYYLEGEPQTERSDIYGLGKVLYEILTGLDRRDDVDFPRLPEGIRGWPDRQLALELNEVVSCACARSPRKRYQSAGEMKADLELLERGKSLKGRKRRERLAYAAGAALALAAAVGLTVGTLRHRKGTSSQSGETTPISLLKLPVWNSRLPLPAGFRADQLRFDTVPLATQSVASVAAEAASLPTNNLALWLKADAGITLDPSGCVSAWNDQSSAGHHANQDVDFRRPKFVATALNGRPGVQFHTHFLNVSGQVITARLFSIFAVVNDTSRFGNGHREIFSNWRKTNRFDSIYFGTSWANPIKARLTDHFSKEGVGAVKDPATHFIFTGVSGASDVQLYQNRDLLGAKGSPLPATTVLTSPYVIGQQGRTASEYWAGDIAELLVYNAELSPADRQRVWDYLQMRYLTVTNAGSPRTESSRSASERLREVKALYDQGLVNDSRVSPGELLQLSYDLRQPPDLLACLELARNIAAAKGDFVAALSACQRIEESFALTPVQMSQMEAAVIRQSQAAAGGLSTHAALSERSILLARRALAMDDYDAAEKFAQAAADSAGVAADALLAAEAGFVKGDVERGREYYRRIESQALKLRQNPDDPQCNLECGKYLCFVKNAWEVGLPMLVRGGNNGFQSLAEQELQHPSKSEDQLNLGNGWWLLAQKASHSERTNCLGRARYWYLKGIASGTNWSEKEEPRRKLQERLNQVPAMPGQLRLLIEVEGSANLTISGDEIRLENSHGARNIRINSFFWGTFPKGGPEILKNYGATRFLPEAVDFSTARIAKRRISRRWGKIERFQPMEDRLEIRLVDAPAGASVFDLLIAFP